MPTINSSSHGSSCKITLNEWSIISTSTQQSTLVQEDNNVHVIPGWSSVKSVVTGQTKKNYFENNYKQ